MASGDTRTQQYLGIAANGNRADLPGETCCETRTQTLTREVAERVIGLDEEVQELKNNPDVVDIVETYQDLEDYNTSTLTDKDIIRVLQDSTHSGNSTYYRWNSATEEFDFVGEISGGGGNVGSVTFYSTVSLGTTASNISLYSDKACTNAIQTADFFQAIRSGKTVFLQSGGSGDYDSRLVGQIVSAVITNIDTSDAYDEVGANAWYSYGSGNKRITLDDIDPTSTNGFAFS